MRDDLGAQLLHLLSSSPDEDICVGRPFYCAKGYEYDFGVRYLYTFLVDGHGEIAVSRNIPLLAL